MSPNSVDSTPAPGAAPLATDTPPSGRHVQILGIRGLPPGHGGFETFAGHLAPYLASRGWQVTVYCQQVGDEDRPESSWRGVRLEHVPSRRGSVGSIAFDLRCAIRSSRLPGPALVFGYNTAIFLSLLRLRQKPCIVNMDGIEWQRKKWATPLKAWFWANERCAASLATTLIADHPAIKDRLLALRPGAAVAMIPYGADRVDAPDVAVLDALDLTPGRYALIVARPEPENSILEMVRAFSARQRACKLVVVGEYNPHTPYHQAVRSAASRDVAFVGPIYDPRLLASLRHYSKFHMYGHTVGGTSPTLVEALAAGSPALCLDTVYSRWVAGRAGVFFSSEATCDALIGQLSDMDSDALAALRRAAYERAATDFTWARVLSEYEDLLLRTYQ